MANYNTQFSFQLEQLTPQEEAWWQDTSEDAWGCSVEIDRHTCWIYGDETLTDELLWAVQNFFAQFRPSAHLFLEYALTCSRPRLDGFGGGEVFVSATAIQWSDLTSWREECLASLPKGETHG